jgi:nitroreductase
MNTLDAIRTRRSIRAYTDQPVSAESVETLLRAAMSAPSAGNQQPWHFIVVDDRGVLQEIARIHPYAGMAAQAPVGILVCGDTREEKYPGYWVQDCSAAVQNLLLAAHDVGLGAVWTGVFPRPDRVEAFRKLFRLPDPVHPLAFIVIGYPAEKVEPADRFRESRIHRNVW